MLQGQFENLILHVFFLFSSETKKKRPRLGKKIQRIFNDLFLCNNVEKEKLID
jgi:hypothetical protein